MNLPARAYDNTKREARAKERKMAMAEIAAQLLREREFADFTLDEVAERADVTVQTVLRAYGSKDALFVTAMSLFAKLDVGDSLRDAVFSGDVDQMIDALFRIYDKIGDPVAHMLAAEKNIVGMKDANDEGREFHRGWVETAFADYLDHLPEDQRRRSYYALFVVTDLYTWKILRRDEGLDLEETISIAKHLAKTLTRKE